MNHFIDLREVLRSLEVDPSTAQDPVKRMFICEGDPPDILVQVDRWATA